MIRLSLDIDVADRRWPKLFPKMKTKVEIAGAYAFLRAKRPAALKNRRLSIGIILTTDRNVRALNRLYRGKDAATNVLSFPQLAFPDITARDLKPFPVKESIPLGDVILALETVKREAKAEKKTVEAHTLHLVAHGVLHLLGYDHMRRKDAKTMENLESDIMAALGYADPYA